MSQLKEGYEFEEQQLSNGIEFLFVSEGNRDIVKIISYVPGDNLQGKRVYNLGFGDYYLASDMVVDDEISNNGDAYKVFLTVLETVPVFFRRHPLDLLVVRGSDSRKEFIESCRLTCRKRCVNACRNFGRRIRIYQAYVNRNYKILTGNYRFFGGYLNEDGKKVLEVYDCHKTYDSLFLCQKNNTFML